MPGWTEASTVWPRRPGGIALRAWIAGIVSKSSSSVLFRVDLGEVGAAVDGPASLVVIWPDSPIVERLVSLASSLFMVDSRVI